jgi:hypothetical protein
MIPNVCRFEVGSLYVWLCWPVKDSARLRLKVAKRLPAIVGVAERSPKLGYGSSGFSSRQRLYQATATLA